MMINQTVAEKLDAGMAAVEDQLRAIVDSDVEVLADAGLHIITSGGKRLRPQLALLAYSPPVVKSWPKVVPMATAVEMVHTATLVHDDINDHSMTRRGRITVHAKWGRTFALLAGDYLFTKVYELMAPYDSIYNVIMADATIKLVEGETLQAAAAKSGNMDRETYKTVISRKTASLFEAASRMGAMLATDDEEIINAAADYAYNLGLAFQIVDDILDIIGDPEVMGKPVGTDLQQNRGVTMVKNGGGHEGTATAVAEKAPDPIAQMMANLRESGAVEIARLQAREMADRARAALERLPYSPVREEMELLIDLVMDRDK
jgi:geranylgeranyl pyrophosphate synthase